MARTPRGCGLPGPRPRPPLSRPHIVVVVVILALFPLTTAVSGFSAAQSVAMLAALVAGIGHLTRNRRTA